MARWLATETLPVPQLVVETRLAHRTSEPLQVWDKIFKCKKRQFPKSSTFPAKFPTNQLRSLANNTGTYEESRTTSIFILQVGSRVSQN